MRVRLESSVRRFGWLLLSLSLAAAIQWKIAADSPLIARDGVRFIQMAQRLHKPRSVFTFYAQHPGYPALIRVVHSLTGPWTGSDDAISWMSAARIASGLCGLSGVAAVWGLTRGLYGPRTANVAALLFAVLPVVRRNAADGLSDAPHLLLYTLATWMLCQAITQQQLRRFLAAGCLSGLAFWIRPEGLSVAIVGALWMGLKVLRAAPANRRPQIAHLAGLTAAAALVIVPYVVLSGKLTSKITQKQRLAQYLNSKHSTGERVAAGSTWGDVQSPTIHNSKFSKSDTTVEQNMLRKISRADAGHVSQNSRPGNSKNAARRSTSLQIGVDHDIQSACFLGILELVTKYIRCVHVLLVPLALAVFVRLRSISLVHSYGLLMSLAVFHAILLQLLFVLGGYIDKRHVLPLVLLATPTASAAIVGFADRFALRLQSSSFTTAHRLLRPIPIELTICAVIVTILLPWAMQSDHTQFRSHEEAARWITQHAHAKSELTCNSPYVPFLAGRSGKVLQRESDLEESIATAAIPTYAHFVVIDVGMQEHFSHKWLRLLDEQFELKATFGGVNGSPHEVRIYESRHTFTQTTPFCCHD